MDAKELRIGNIVEVEDGSKIRVDEIRLTEQGYVVRAYPRIKLKRPNDFTGITRTYLDFFIDEVYPVKITSKLTEEAFGWTKGVYTTDALHGYFNSLPYRDRLIVIYSNMTYHCARIEYLHQFQNLYFSLTGEELLIKKV